MLTLRDRLWRRSGAWLALSYRASTPPCTPVKAAFTKGRQMQTLHFRVAPKDTPGIGAEWAGRSPVGHRADSQVEADLLGRRPAPATPPPGHPPSPEVALSGGGEFDHRLYPIWVTGEPATLPMARAGRPRRSCQGAGRTGAATRSVPAVPEQASPSSHPGTLVPFRPSYHSPTAHGLVNPSGGWQHSGKHGCKLALLA
jgi:hypothetical protein